MRDREEGQEEGRVPPPGSPSSLPFVHTEQLQTDRQTHWPCMNCCIRRGGCDPHRKRGCGCDPFLDTSGELGGNTAMFLGIRKPILGPRVVRVMSPADPDLRKQGVSIHVLLGPPDR